MGFQSINVSGKQPKGYQKVGSTTYEADHVLATGARTAIMIRGYNSGPDQFIQLHNAAAAPADTAVPYATVKAWGADNFYFLIPVCGLPQEDFSAGIYVCNSTTGPTKTLGAADCWFEAYLV